MYTVSEYLFEQLHKLGVKHIFGVPGDYNLTFLDDILKHNDLEWVGNCNELNAAYAADGYARINGISALVTTYGVGELSAINGIAGSYAENVPVVEITGTPSTNVIKEKLCVHHSLGDGDFNHFSNMFKEVTVAQTFLTQENAVEEINRVLVECLKEKRPVHINLPMDVCNKPVICNQIVGNEIEDLVKEKIKSNKEILAEFVKDAKLKIENSKQPVILVDFQVDRYCSRGSLYNLAQKTGFPVASLSMGKGIFPEKDPQFIGIYSGALSSDYIRKRVDEADCIISLGIKLTDLNTGGFSQGFSDSQIIEINPHSSRIKDKQYNAIFIKDVIDELTLIINHRNSNQLNIKSNISQYHLSEEKYIPKSNKKLTQKRFWQRIYEFLKEKDIVIADQGTPFFGSSRIPLPKDSIYINQPLWGSIGYTLPALLGAQLADINRRNILIIGDGSFQLTAQELSTMLKQNIKPIIFVINNNGYTIERLIHGRNECYNDINMWQYNKLPYALTKEKNFNSYKIENEEELEVVLNNLNKNEESLNFIEVIMDQNDLPKALEESEKWLKGEK
ncbi:alpha-keto acid decarboxylase family protein [Clostridium felsineum]|uniref:alpha-keto acid decarboxylase family protein n=1 Tax=Clostridium felsineum TaxID=36839 RepID=UPI00098BDEE4|nr:alpha-keto acid decarboxylase family protein [Clostridium felsineum]URZ01551.1 Indole-3-pyruvate decarboxylase [Clostridium felsineum]